MITTAGNSLASIVWDAGARFSQHAAVHVDDRTIGYAELLDSAARIGAVLRQADSPLPRLGAVFAARSATAYAGVLATLVSGAGYVPLNPKFPITRTAHMLAVSDASTVVVGEDCLDQLDDVIECVERSLLVVVPTRADVSALRVAHPRHRFAGQREIAATEPLGEPSPVDPASIAYLLFTSGSTGSPKGVMVSHANVLAVLDSVWRRYDITQDDRFSQSFDLTFDLSVFDLFASWGRGASLHCIPDRSLMAPDEFIRERQLSIWFSVPSVGMMLHKLRRLAPDAFPTLRWSLFCGERLPMDVADAWQRAAPRSKLENLYGPTEATIACTLYRWSPASTSACVGGTVPIGIPFPGMTTAVVDDELREVPDGKHGELCVKGPQVSHGYWRDPAKSAERFVAMPWFSGPDNRWYRTGDIAYVDGEGNLIHCGRNDDQIKLHGFRIELPEIEHIVRTAAGTSFAVVLPFPENQYGPTGLTAVVAGTAASEDQLVAAARAALPEYMVPSTFVFVTELPLNANGKIDRNAVLAALRDGRYA